ncbi:hypothetical protein FNF31_06934 [Cafeteria roenbergensis]|uniref:Uncharacterized protein n=1 Tax=Cafeteria roenbergensis TaxID=33653 RepID=A0A5A8CCQ9_CAFRO|nr:hypothetical protein FNF31_06934 [Cafeteria roenbergensis]
MSTPMRESSVILTPFPPTLYNSRRDDRGRLDSRTRFVFHIALGSRVAPYFCGSKLPRMAEGKAVPATAVARPGSAAERTGSSGQGATRAPSRASRSAAAASAGPASGPPDGGIAYCSSEGVGMAGQFPVDDEALSHASSGLSLSSLVDVDVLYFDGTIPTVFLTDSEDDRSRGSLHPVPLPSADLTLQTSPVPVLQVSLLPKSLPISTVHANRPFILSIVLAGTEVVTTRQFCVSAKEPKDPPRRIVPPIQRAEKAAKTVRRSGGDSSERATTLVAMSDAAVAASLGRRPDAFALEAWRCRLQGGARALDTIAPGAVGRDQPVSAESISVFADDIQAVMPQWADPDAATGTGRRADIAQSSPAPSPHAMHHQMSSRLQRGAAHFRSTPSPSPPMQPPSQGPAGHGGFTRGSSGGGGAGAAGSSGYHSHGPPHRAPTSSAAAMGPGPAVLAAHAGAFAGGASQHASQRTPGRADLGQGPRADSRQSTMLYGAGAQAYQGGGPTAGHAFSYSGFPMAAGSFARDVGAPAPASPPQLTGGWAVPGSMHSSQLYGGRSASATLAMEAAGSPFSDASAPRDQGARQPPSTGFSGRQGGPLHPQHQYHSLPPSSSGMGYRYPMQSSMARSSLLDRDASASPDSMIDGSARWGSGKVRPLGRRNCGRQPRHVQRQWLPGLGP